MTPLEAFEVCNRIEELLGKDGNLNIYRMPKSFTVEIHPAELFQQFSGKTLLDALRKAGDEKGRGK